VDNLIDTVDIIAIVALLRQPAGTELSFNDVGQSMGDVDSM
jgi:hypothetical protein